MKRLVVLAASLTLMIAGCASSGSSPEDERARLLSMRPAVDSIPASGLGPQEVAPGACGLFLWSKTDVSKFIFYSEALSGTAKLAQDELPIDLIQTRAGGDIFGQFNTIMNYESQDRRNFDLRLVPGELLEGGQRIESGMLTMTDREGWQTKLPVLGVRACQPE